MKRHTPRSGRTARSSAASLFAALALVLAACASGQSFQSVSEQLPPLAAGEGRVYFYRPSGMAAALKPRIMVNEASVGTAQSKGFLFIDREPGEYTVSTSTLLEHTLHFQLAAGETKYVKLRSSVGLIAGHIIPSLATEQTALRELQGMKYVGDASVLDE